MGQRGEISSRRIFADDGRKTYFFNIKENRNHDLYLNIVVSRKKNDGFKRSSIVIFQENIVDFSDMLNNAIDAIQQNKPVHLSFQSDNGRREYNFQNSQRGRPALLINEERNEIDGKGYRESVYVEIEQLEIFIEGFKKSVGDIERLIKNG